MKPFNLEAAKAGAPIVTGNLDPATYIAVAPTVTDPMSRLVVEVRGRVKVYSEEGKYQTYDSEDDLFMAPQKKTVWVNFFPNGEAFYHDTEERAIQGRKNFYDEDVALGCKPSPVEIEE